MGPAPAERNAVSRRVFSKEFSGDEPSPPRRTGLIAALGSLVFVAFALVSLPGLNARADSASPAEATTVIVVVGAAGEDEFRTNFIRQAELWEGACALARCHRVTLGVQDPGGTNDYAALQQTLAAEPNDGTTPLWLVLIGHGTFDGTEAKFNLRGPDVSSTELALWLKPFHRPLAVIDTASASGPFLKTLSATNRVVITATRSGHEQNFTRFGTYLAEALTQPESDLDKDGQVSLLEAFLSAAHRVSEFYKAEGRLATEHALIDDNGDGLGTPADWFRGSRPVKKPKETTAVDGAVAQQFHLIPGEADRQLSTEQRTRRDELVGAILQHRDRKAELAEDDYYRQLEKLLLELAHLYTPVTNSPPAKPLSPLEAP